MGYLEDMYNFVMRIVKDIDPGEYEFKISLGPFRSKKVYLKIIKERGRKEIIISSYPQGKRNEYKPVLDKKNWEYTIVVSRGVVRAYRSDVLVYDEPRGVYLLSIKKKKDKYEKNIQNKYKEDIGRLKKVLEEILRSV